MYHIIKVSSLFCHSYQLLFLQFKANIFLAPLTLPATAPISFFLFAAKPFEWVLFTQDHQLPCSHFFPQSYQFLTHLSIQTHVRIINNYHIANSTYHCPILVLPNPPAAFDPVIFFLSHWLLLLSYLTWSPSSPDIWMLKCPRAESSALFSIFIHCTGNLSSLMKETSEHFTRNTYAGSR